MTTVMMRYGSIFATMFVVASVSALGNDGTIDRYEVVVVGEEVGKPYSTIDSLDPLTVVSFFEAHPKQFKDDSVDKSLIVEIFANAPKDQDDCSKGVLLENIIDINNGFTIKTELYPFPNYNEVFKDIGGDTKFPQTSNGEVGAAKFTLSDYEYFVEGSGKQIYFKDRGIVDGGGQIEFCVRVSIKLDYDNDGEADYVSHFDSFKTISIDLAATFASFEGLDVQIDSTGATNFVSEETKTVEVNSFLCDDDNNSVVDSKSYGIGQNFRICVGPKDTEDGNIKVKDFKSLVCGEDDRRRQLVLERKALPLTEVDKKADSNGVLGVTSVITDGFSVAGEVTSTISCKGKVMLKYKDQDDEDDQVVTGTIPTRKLLTSDISGSTILQYKESSSAVEVEAEVSSISPFSMSINIDTPNNGSSASPLTTFPGTSAVIGMTAILSFIASLLL